jgi:hypothetical protein
MTAKTTQIRINARKAEAVDAAELLVIDSVLERLWAELGLSKSSLGSYRRDLIALSRFLGQRQLRLDEAMQTDLFDFCCALSRIFSIAMPQASGFYRLRAGIRSNLKIPAEMHLPRSFQKLWNTN